MNTLRSLMVLIATLWVGATFCIGFVVAPYLFTLAARHDAAVPNTAVAADLIVPLINGANVVGVAVPVMLMLGLVILRRHGLTPMGNRVGCCQLALTVALLCSAANYWSIGPAVAAVRVQIIERYGGSHLADKADPLYQRFATIHSISTTVFMIGFVAGVVALICMTHFRPRPVIVTPEI